MSVALPAWRTAAQRERESELVFRGEQYAHAIGMFQRRTANAYPPNLDVLVQQKFLDFYAKLDPSMADTAVSPNADSAVVIDLETPAQA